ncbi:hypothetical protein [Chryseobacterium jejuense]|uniref:hypothetical protein n=1 Tax=Chryseobacterium jejuense TaxID=445960 RepID=UPI001AEB97B4|nr:hypothetical protein [Chryseobacterium jejuense]MBP2615369.1 hypothetical protein [Chryseobacterium jejuense]
MNSIIFVENDFFPLKKVLLAQSEFGFRKEPRPEDLRFLTQETVQKTLKTMGNGKDKFTGNPEKISCERSETPSGHFTFRLRTAQDIKS